MTDLEHSISSILHNNQYNHLIDLLDIPQETSPWIKTLELFTFGTISQYIKYKHEYIELDQYLVVKLVKLSLISCFNDHEGDSISIEEILSEYGIGQGLKLISNKEIEESLHELIIELVFQGIVDVKINDREGVVDIVKCKILRDAYNSRYYSLRVLTEEDIGNRSLSKAYETINSWYLEKLKPINQEFESKIKVDVEVIKSKKRKSPDNNVFS